MGISSLSTFIKKYIKVADGFKDIYNNRKTKIVPWEERDFDTKEIVLAYDADPRALVRGVVKPAYDIVRSYHRSYLIYNQSRGDYYRFADQEREKDKLILEQISSNLDRVYDDLTYVEGV